MRHNWQQLAYDARTSINQPRRWLSVCVHCGMEKDVAARTRSWVVGWRLHGGRRYACTSTWVATPGCPGRLPGPEDVAAWDRSVREAEVTLGPSMARGYAL